MNKKKTKNHTNPNVTLAVWGLNIFLIDARTDD